MEIYVKKTSTRGPWNLVNQGSENSWMIKYNKKKVVHVLTEIDCDKYDARLITSAPELLELAEQTEVLIKTIVNKKATTERIWCAINKAYVLLNKVKLKLGQSAKKPVRSKS
jgi:hypothetical protein